MSESVFNENAGRYISRREVQTLREAHRDGQLTCGLKENEYTQSEFFGAKKLLELLNAPNCVGLRVHYAKRWEDDADKPTEKGKGRLKPRVLLTAVDARGRDIALSATSGRVDGGKDDGDDNGAVGDGYTCPRHCPQ